jgi:phytol kinase
LLSSVLNFTLNLPLWLQITVVAVWVLLILLIAWVTYRFTDAEPEIVRKIVHIGTGNVIMLAWWLHVPAILGISASIIASVITLLSYKFPLLPGINSVGRQSFGTFFYALSMGVLVGLFWHIDKPQYAAIGIMVMAWGDGLAALIGQRFGKHKYKIFGAQKSWEGSLTMALVSFTISSLILFTVQGNTLSTWVASLAIAVVATSLESISFLGIDNLTVPLGSATLAFLCIEILGNYLQI